MTNIITKQMIGARSVRFFRMHICEFSFMVRGSALSVHNVLEGGHLGERETPLPLATVDSVFPPWPSHSTVSCVVYGRATLQFILTRIASGRQSLTHGGFQGQLCRKCVITLQSNCYVALYS